VITEPTKTKIRNRMPMLKQTNRTATSRVAINRAAINITVIGEEQIIRTERNHQDTSHLPRRTRSYWIMISIRPIINYRLIRSV